MIHKNKFPIRFLRYNAQLHIWKGYSVAAQPKAEAAVEGKAREWQEAKPFKSLPGLSTYQWVRSFMKGGEFEGSSLNDMFRKCRQKYGDTFTFPGVFGQTPMLCLFNVDHFAHVFRTEGTYPQRPGNEAFIHYRRSRKDGFFNDWEGLTGSGEQWAKFRHAVNPVLMQPRNAKLYLNPVQSVSEDFIRRVREIRSSDSLEMPETFEREINFLIFESVSVVALDTRMGLLTNQGDRQETNQLFKYLNIMLNSFFELSIKPSMYKYFKTPTYRRFEKASDVVFDVTGKYVNEAIERLAKQPPNTEPNSVLGKLLQINPKIAQVMAMDMLLAGVDTSTSAMCVTMMCLAKNPDKQQKLREEVLSIVPNKGDKFTIENMKDMPYLRACIKEALRVYPLFLGNFRGAVSDLVIDGYQVPKGTRITMCSNLLLNEEKYFPRPTEYLPERWLRSEKKGVTAENLNPFIYLPFGFGPRFCIGKRIVDLMLEINISNLVRNFKLEFNHPTEGVFKDHTLLKAAKPLKFKFINLNQDA